MIFNTKHKQILNKNIALNMNLEIKYLKEQLYKISCLSNLLI